MGSLVRVLGGELEGLALPTTCCVALDKSLNLSESLFPLLKMKTR